MTEPTLRIGLVGLGRAATGTLPSMQKHPNITVTVKPASGGIHIANTPLTIINTLNTIDHVAD